MASDWDAQSIITLIVGFTAMCSLWAVLIWTMANSRSGDE